MENTESDTIIIEGYLQLLDNLSPASKLDLISRLSASVRSDLTGKGPSFQNAFGAFQSDKSAEEIIDEICSSHSFIRQIEEF